MSLITRLPRWETTHTTHAILIYLIFDWYMTQTKSVLHPILSWLLCVLTILLEIKSILTRFGCDFWSLRQLSRFKYFKSVQATDENSCLKGVLQHFLPNSGPTDTFPSHTSMIVLTTTEVLDSLVTRLSSRTSCAQQYLSPSLLFFDHGSVIIQDHWISYLEAACRLWHV